MATNIFMIGAFKNGKKLIGVRLLAIDSVNLNDTKIYDVNCNKVIEIIKSGQLKVENLKVENGNLKGVNGSIDRYGVLSADGAIHSHKAVVMLEVEDKNGIKAGYIMSDTAGEVKYFSKVDAITLAKNIGLANGKLVEKAGGSPSIMAIDGGYRAIRSNKLDTKASSAKRVPQNKTAAEPEVKPTSIQKKDENMTVNTPVSVADTAKPKEKAIEVQKVEDNKAVEEKPMTAEEKALEEAKALIAELKKKPNYNQLYSSNIAATIERYGRASEKQINILKKDLGLLSEEDQNKAAEKDYQDALSVIQELEEYKGYKGSKANDIADTVKRYKKASTRQLSYLRKDLEKYKKNNAEKIDPEEEKRKAEEELRRQEELKRQREEDEKRREAERKKALEDAEKRRAEEAARREEEIKRQIEEQKQRKLAKELEEEQKKLDEEARLDDYKMRVVNAWSDYDTKHKRQYLNMPTVESTNKEDVYTYAQMDNGSIYVTGFKKDKFTENVIIPDTVEINGRLEKVEGIAIKAFARTNIKAVKTGVNIKDIGQEAFSHCEFLEIIDLSQSKHQMIPMKMCSKCVRLQKAHIGNNILRIHELAFNDCYDMETIICGTNVETIARHAFFCCKRLVNINFSAKNINDSAFCKCYSLHNFNFNETLTIGTYAFKCSGFSELTLPGTITSIGNGAFAQCALLSSVKIEEGVEVLKDLVFSKNEHDMDCREQKRFNEAEAINPPYVEIEVIDAPRSLNDLGDKAFGDAKLVLVFTGTPSESNCVTFGNVYKQKDAVNLDNSTKLRVKSGLIGANPIEQMHNDFQVHVENASNPEFDMSDKNTVEIPLGTFIKSNFNIGDPSEEEKEPHIKFKAVVNYLQDICGKAFQNPLSVPVLRLGETLNSPSEILYDDGYNRIAKIKYEVKDTLESGGFIMCTSGDKVVYLAELTDATNIDITKDMDTDIIIPIKRHIHQGDKIGLHGVMDGKKAEYEYYPYENDTTKPSYIRTRPVKENLGDEMYQRIVKNGIAVKVSRTSQYIWVPAADVVLSLTTLKDDNEKADERGKTFTVGDFLTYKKFVSLMKPKHKSEGFFKELESLSNYEVQRRIQAIRVIGMVKQAQIYKPSKELNALAPAGKLTAKDLTPKLLFALTESYWMVDKGVDWISKESAKSLNLTNEYTIQNYRVIEYKSNQVVKFSNAYMEGTKNAYVFKIMAGNNPIGAYASRFSLEEIVIKLRAATYIPKSLASIEPPVLMQQPDKIDIVPAEWFFQFKDVLKVKNGWKLADYARKVTDRYYRLENALNRYYCSFSLSMYKPTGVFYLVMNAYVLESNKSVDNKEQVRSREAAYVLLPIGNLERALLVANTTNSNNRGSNFLDEIMRLACAEVAKNLVFKDKEAERNIIEQLEANCRPYYKVREMLTSGINDVAQYSKYIDDRAVFMIGLVPDDMSKLQVEETGEFIIADDTIDNIDDADEKYDEFFDDELESDEDLLSDLYGDDEFIEDEDETFSFEDL